MSVFDLIGADGVRRPFTGDIEDLDRPAKDRLRINQAEATRLAEAEGLSYIAPFDDPRVIAGQGTIGLELIQQDAHLDRVFVPVGGGGACPPKSRMQFDWVKFQQSLETLQFQRCEFKV